MYRVTLVGIGCGPGINDGWARQRSALQIGEGLVQLRVTAGEFFLAGRKELQLLSRKFHCVEKNPFVEKILRDEEKFITYKRSYNLN